MLPHETDSTGTAPVPRTAPTLDPVTEGDHAVLRALADTIWRQHYPGLIAVAQIDYMLARRFSAEALRDYTAAADRWLGLLRVAGTPVGYLAYEPADDRGAAGPAALKLGQLYVLVSPRGIGLGRFMLRHVEERARDLGRPAVVLQVNKRNTGAVAFYAAAGFTIAREAVFDIGSGFVMDDYVMEKLVAPRPAPASPAAARPR